MLAEMVWISNGSQVGMLSNPRHVLSFNDYANMTAASVKTIKKDRKIPVSKLWKNDRRRKTVETMTFHAGEPPICRDPDGRNAFNIWRPIERHTINDADLQKHIEPFMVQVAYLFQDPTERDVFLDWLAHIEQLPGKLPHYGWLHIATNTGTGRNWLASVLSRVWRGYVAPNVDLPQLLRSDFNGTLAGRVLVIADEVQEGGGETPYRHASRLKSLVNEETRNINPKYGRQYREWNSCRWLVFSNHDNALPLVDTDRRWWVVRHRAAPRAPSDYSQLYGLLDDPEFINAVGVYLQGRNIRTFNPGERPPINEAKRAIMDASRSVLSQHAMELVKAWPCEVITNGDVTDALRDSDEWAPTSVAVHRVMLEVGAIQYQNGKPVNVSGKSARCWILRNMERWMNAAPYEIAAEIERARKLGFGNDALEILANSKGR
ncbi:MAG: DUF5906 domain-containing protein [Pseudomonadales bacterium]|jgi:hypothetical protein|nr:DUF5906 domain-containing protein [Pseudomonadales bacterium]